MYLPLFFKLDQMPCLLVGGGKQAAHKARILEETGALITVIAPQIADSIKKEVESGSLRWQKREFREGDCTGFRLVVAATQDSEVNRAVALEARQKGIPVNVVDVPDLCTVIFAANWREGPLSISVSTGGAAPFMAAEIRDRLADFSSGLGEWVEAASRFRAAVRATVAGPRERDLLYQRFLGRSREKNLQGVPVNEQLADWLVWLDT